MYKKDCWILTDSLTGHEKQSISLAEKLNINFKIIKTKKLNFIERILINFFNLKKTKKLKAPFPKIIISCGKNTAYYSRFLKKKSKKIFSIFIQKPPININNFNIVIAPKHDNCIGPNTIQTQGSLTKINMNYIKSIAKKKRPYILKKKYIAMLMGGNSRHHKITANILNKIIDKLNFLQNKYKLNFFIILSRRTKNNHILYLKKNLSEKYFTFIKPSMKKIPYLKIISFAKAIIVTSDSVSMVTEACSSGKSTYIIKIPSKSKKFSLFIKNLIDLKLVYYLKNSLSLNNKKKALNDIEIVIKEIKKKIKF
tara:strand:- start:797 stop:1729 length:933 start_codon:yes stop_codon:yes gene_type:complete